jgi:cytochrome P450
MPGAQERTAAHREPTGRWDVPVASGAEATQGQSAASLQGGPSWISISDLSWLRRADRPLRALGSPVFWRPELIRIKRTRPGDDLLSALIAARDSGDRLSEEELTNLACTILVVGYETTAHHISLSLLALLDHPAGENLAG